MKIGTTEARNPHSVDIDLMDSMQIVQLINEEDHKVAEGVKEALPQIAQAVDMIVEKLRAGGRRSWYFWPVRRAGRCGMPPNL